MKKNLFITGTPNTGKTTLIKEVCLPWLDDIGGFYTQELREKGERLGFILKTFSGEEIVFAKKGFKSKYRVGKYGVDIKALEKVGVKAMEDALNDKKVIVIDEIGLMEISSDKFRAVLVQCLNSPKKVLATIRFRAQPFTDEIKKMAETEVMYLSRENYLEVKDKIRKWLEKALSS